MDQKEALDLYKFYFTDMKDLYEGYMHFVITMSISILTVIGWFLTSEKAQKMVATHKIAVPAFLSAIVLTAGVELFVIDLLVSVSQKIQTIMTDLASRIPLTKSYYEYRKIGWPIGSIYFAFHFSLLAILGFIIVKSSKSGNTSENEVLKPMD